jgi:hypothetical protein
MSSGSYAGARSVAQILSETAWHEAGHAVFAHAVGRKLTKAYVLPPDEMSDALGNLRDVDHLGRVEWEPYGLVSISDAIDRLCVGFAGEITAATAFMVDAGRDDLTFGRRRISAAELSAEELAVVSNTNGNRAQAAAAFGVYRMAAEGDLAHAREIALEWTSSGLQAEAMLAFCRIRCADAVSSEWFQQRAAILAGHLERAYVLEGDDLRACLDRAAYVFPQTEPQIEQQTEPQEEE